MNLQRIKAILLQEWYITIRSMEVVIDVFFYPFVNIIVFGFLSLYLSGTNREAGQFVLLGMLLWQVVWVVQYSVSLGSLWNIWAKNLSNMFIAPLTISEYLLAETITGILKAIFILTGGAVISAYLFDFDLLQMGILPIFLTFINLSFFAFSLGVAIIGLIFRFGTRIQALAWGLIAIFQPLSAAFYPLSIMPPVLQQVAYLFPATFSFEAARYALATQTVNWQLFGIAFAENLIYFALCMLFFHYMYKKSRDTGQFARNES